MLWVILLSGLLFLSWDIGKWRDKDYTFHIGQTVMYLVGALWAWMVFYLWVAALTPSNLLAYIILPAALLRLSIFTYQWIDSSADSMLVLVHAGLAAVAILLWGGLHVANFFQAHAKYEFLNTETVEKDMDVTNPDELRVVFEPTARKAVDKIFGQIPQVNYFEIGGSARVTINKEAYFLFPIEHKKPFMAFKQGPAPGYGLVSTNNTSVKAEIKQDYGTMYAPNGFLSRNVYRQIRSSNLDVILFEAHYEVDDEGKPYWIVPYGSKQLFQSMEVVEGSFLVDPTTGKFEKVPAKDTPPWVDYIIPEDVAVEYFDWFAYYKHGWWNANFSPSPVDVLKPVSSIREVYDDNQRMWWFIDFTRASGVRAEAMVGYALMDPITGEIKYHTSSQISRYMNADAAVTLVNAGPTDSFRARGLKGTDATFYTLFGTGAWVIPVVDASNSMAGIAIVPANATKAEHVAFGATKTAVLEDFKRKIAKADIDAGINVDAMTEKTETLVISQVQVDQSSVAFYTETTGDVMFEVGRESYPTSRMLIPGDKVKVTYTITPGSVIAPVTGFEKVAQ